jgi:hypothetical protein
MVIVAHALISGDIGAAPTILMDRRPLHDADVSPTPAAAAPPAPQPESEVRTDEESIGEQEEPIVTIAATEVPAPTEAIATPDLTPSQTSSIPQLPLIVGGSLGAISVALMLVAWSALRRRR